MFFLHSRSALGGAVIVVLTVSLWPGLTSACPLLKDISNGSFRCEKECMAQTQRAVFGTLIYGEKSDACLAGLHAGVLGLNGGILLTQQKDGPGGAIQGTCRNRVCSKGYEASGSVYTVGNGTLVTERVRGDVLLVHNNYKNEQLNTLCLSEDPNHTLSAKSIKRWNYGDIGTTQEVKESPSKVTTTSHSAENRHAFRCLGRTPASDVLGPVIFPNADVKTTQYTFRASKGDAFQVRFSQPETLPVDTEIRRLPGSHSSKVSLNYTNVQSDATALYIAGDGKSGAYFNIIIRDCEAGKYGGECQHACPRCKNGGECHSSTGECICPPGFTGNLCQTACPKGYVGNDCKLQCSRKEFLFSLPVEDSCEGLTFCLPDPLGCTCAAGYKGVLCDQSCDVGEYGAGCLRSCQEKCQTDGCDPVTGKCPPSLPKNMEIKVAYPRSLNISWESSVKDEEGHQDRLLYHVGYKLLTHMSCNYEERNEEWNRIVVEKQPIVISGLEAHASYNVCLYIHRESDAKTTIKKCYTAETGIEVPTLNVTELMCIAKGSDSILCSAEVDGTCAHYNGPGAELSFSLSYDDCNGTDILIEESELLSPDIDQFHSGIVNHTFSGLIPGQRFLPAVQVKRVPVPEQRTTVPVFTKEKAPPPVKDLEVIQWNETDAKVVWNAPCPSNGKILSYKITIEDKVYKISSEDEANCSDVDGYTYCFVISHLKMGPTYRAKITAETSNFQSQEHKFNFTTYARPSAPLLQEGERYKNALNVSINPPTSPGGRLRNCSVVGPKDSCVIPFQEESETMRCEIKNLESGTKYTIEAYCCNAMFCGERLEIEMSTRPLPVFQGSVQRNSYIATTNSTIPLTLPRLTNTGETESNLVVFVESIQKDGQIQRHDIRNKSLELLSNFSRSRQGRQENSQGKHLCGESIWIAAVLPATYEQVEVGDGNTYGGFQNCPLEHEESYSIGVLGITDMQGEPKYWQTVWQQLEEPVAVTVTTHEELNKQLLLLVILCVQGALILIFILVLIVFLCWRCLAKKEEDAIVIYKKETTEDGGDDLPIRTDG